MLGNKNHQYGNNFGEDKTSREARCSERITWHVKWILSGRWMVSLTSSRVKTVTDGYGSKENKEDEMKAHNEQELRYAIGQKRKAVHPRIKVVWQFG